MGYITGNYAVSQAKLWDLLDFPGEEDYNEMANGQQKNRTFYKESTKIFAASGLQRTGLAPMCEAYRQNYIKRR